MDDNSRDKDVLDEEELFEYHGKALTQEEIDEVTAEIRF